MRKAYEVVAHFNVEIDVPDELSEDDLNTTLKGYVDCFSDEYFGGPIETVEDMLLTEIQNAIGYVDYMTLPNLSKVKLNATMTHFEKE